MLYTGGEMFLKSKLLSKWRGRGCCQGLYLRHVTDKIVLMQVPPPEDYPTGEGVSEGRLHKMMSNAAADLKYRHHHSFMVYNIGNDMPNGVFDNQVVDLKSKFDSSMPGACPKVDALLSLCQSGRSWLASDKSHVMVLNCLPGQKALVASCVKVFMAACFGHSHTGTLEAYLQLCEDLYETAPHGSPTPSQRRFFMDWISLLAREGTSHVYAAASVEPPPLATIRLSHLPLRISTEDRYGPCRPMVMVFKGSDIVYSSLTKTLVKEVPLRTDVTLPVGLQVNGDLVVHLYHLPPGKQGQRICCFSIHTAFINPQTGTIKLCKREISDVAFDPRIDQDFSVDFKFSHEPPPPAETPATLAPTSSRFSTSLIDASGLANPSSVGSLGLAGNVVEPREAESDEEFARRLQAIFDAENMEAGSMHSMTSLDRYQQPEQRTSVHDLQAEMDQQALADYHFAQLLQQQLLLDDGEHVADSQGVAGHVAHIQTLPVVVFRSASGRVEECQVCRMPYEDHDLVKTLPCIHRYHVHCIDPWLYMKGTCPVCQFPIDRDCEEHLEAADSLAEGPHL